MVESTGTKERNVYEHSIALKIQDYKISAIDVHGIHLLNLLWLFRICDDYRFRKGLCVPLWYYDRQAEESKIATLIISLYFSN